MIILETERLYLRRFVPGDAAGFYRLNGDPELMRFIRPVKDREQSDAFLAQAIAAYETEPFGGRWALIEKQTHRFAGSFVLIPLEGAGWQVGYVVLQEFWSQGYAFEALQATVRHAFEEIGLPKVFALTDPDNTASRNLLTKSGFVLQETTTRDGKPVCLFVKGHPHLVETERLYIFPLNHFLLRHYLEAEDWFEKALGLTTTGRAVSPEVRDMVKRVTLPQMENAGKEGYLFHTFWLAVLASEKTIVAEMGFKGAPGKKGEVEIGYGTMPSMRGKGYMTEAVGGIAGWARRQGKIHRILAETHPANAASIRILEKNHFARLGKKRGMLWWQLPLS